MSFAVLVVLKYEKVQKPFTAKELIKLAKAAKYENACDI